MSEMSPAMSLLFSAIRAWQLDHGRLPEIVYMSNAEFTQVRRDFGMDDVVSGFNYAPMLNGIDLIPHALIAAGNMLPMMRPKLYRAGGAST